jgi:hypothetical protein
MPKQRDDPQLHLSLQTRGDAQPSKKGVIKKDRPVIDLGSVRTSRHGAIVLERVIREGFTKKK